MAVYALFEEDCYAGFVVWEGGEKEIGGGKWEGVC